MYAVGYLSWNPQYPALRSFNRLAQWISILGHGRSTESITRQWLHVRNLLSTCMPLAIFCGWQWPSMDTVDNGLCSTMSIDLDYHKPNVAHNTWYLSIDTFHNPLSRTIYIYLWIDLFTHKRYTHNGYRWIACSVHCDRQWPSLGISPNPLWLALATNGRGWRSVFFDNVYRSTDCSITHQLSATISTSMYAFHNLLSPTISIDRLPPSFILEAIDHSLLRLMSLVWKYHIHHADGATTRHKNMSDLYVVGNKLYNDYTNDTL